MPRTAYLVALAAVAIAATVPAIGCGDDENGGGPSQGAADDAAQADQGGREGGGSGSGGQGSNGEATAPGSGEGGGSAAADGSPGEPATAASRRRKKRFVKQANRDCEKAREKMLEEMAVYVERRLSGSKPQGVLIAEAVRRTMLPILRGEIAEIRALNAPPGDEQRIAAMLAAQEEAIEEVAGLESTTLRKVEDHFDEAAEELTAYGLSKCAF